MAREAGTLNADVKTEEDDIGLANVQMTDEAGAAEQGQSKTKGSRRRNVGITIGEPMLKKGKDVDPEEKGELYEKLRSLAEKDKEARVVKKQKTAVFSMEPERFKREKSEKPDGGWFHATTRSPKSSKSRKNDTSSSETSEPEDDDSPHSAPPPDSPSKTDSSAPSSAPSDPAEGGTRRRKKSKKALSNVKIKTPFMYNGKADLDVFDQWTYEVDTWCRWHGIDKKTAVQVLVQFLEGKASRFFMRHVSQNLKKWDTKKVYEGLFDYCFPAHFKLELREKMMSANQGSQTVRDYARELEMMAMRFPDITEREVTLIFWQGIHQGLRLYLIEKGMNPERTTLERLIKYANRREEAWVARKREEQAWKGQPTGRRWGRFANRSG